MLPRCSWSHPITLLPLQSHHNTFAVRIFCCLHFLRLVLLLFLLCAAVLSVNFIQGGSIQEHLILSAPSGGGQLLMLVSKTCLTLADVNVANTSQLLSGRRHFYMFFFTHKLATTNENTDVILSQLCSDWLENRNQLSQFVNRGKQNNQFGPDNFFKIINSQSSWRSAPFYELCWCYLKKKKNTMVCQHEMCHGDLQGLAGGVFSFVRIICS